MKPGESEFRVRIVIEAKGRRYAEAIRNSLAPDNRDFPMGLSMDSMIDGNLLVLEFVSSGKISTLISTVDDVLMNCQVAAAALEMTE